MNLPPISPLSPQGHGKLSALAVFSFPPTAAKSFILAQSLRPNQASAGVQYFFYERLS